MIGCGIICGSFPGVETPGCIGSVPSGQNEYIARFQRLVKFVCGCNVESIVGCQQRQFK